jgi:hypothetical protein
MQNSKYLSMMTMMMINYIQLSDNKLIQGKKIDSRAIYSILLRQLDTLASDLRASGSIPGNFM